MTEKILIFRMTHIDNLRFILQNGLWSMLSNVQDPDFVTIGNIDVIGKRKEYAVKVVPPGGVLGEYVPFYFAGHSPMLLNIITGYGVSKLLQRDIVFIVCDAKRIFDSSLEWCFTDGHAKKAITKFFNQPECLEQLDWRTINSTVWKDTEEDTDRQRKKMSEFLVRNHVPVEMIRCFVVHNDDSKQKVESLVLASGLKIPVHIDTNNHLYYKDYD